MERKQNVDYHSLPGLSNSRCKLLRKSVPLFKKAVEEGWGEDQKKHHVEGTMIDLLLLDYEKFNQTYILGGWETPSSANQQKFCEEVVAGTPIDEAYNRSYASNHKPETLKRKSQELYNTLKEHINYLNLHADKTIYTKEQNDMLMSIQHNAFNHPKVSKRLNSDKAEHHVVFTGELLGELFKGEVDLFIDAGQVVWNIDVKSTKSHLAFFPYEYRKYGYDKQQGLYYKLIRAWLDSQGRQNVPIMTECIAISKQFPHEVLLFKPHMRLLAEGWQWIKESTEIYKYHKKKGFLYPKQTYEEGVEDIFPYGYQEPEEEDS